MKKNLSNKKKTYYDLRVRRIMTDRLSIREGPSKGKRTAQGLKCGHNSVRRKKKQLGVIDGVWFGGRENARYEIRFRGKKWGQETEPST